MNWPTLIVRAALVVTLATLAVGCKKGNKSLTPIPVSGDSYAGGNNSAAGNMMQGDGLGSGDSLNGGNFPNGNDLDGGGYGLPDDPNRFAGKDETKLDAETVYFEFDRYTVNASELPKIKRVASMLKGEAAALLRVEGHCDDRGTEEYNRSLGERRALSIRDMLVGEGISPDRITTESWGEDRPAVEGDGEAAHSKNRRGEFVILR